MTKIKVILFVLLSVVIISSACNDLEKVDNVSLEIVQGVEGYVTIGMGGEPSEGSTVEVRNIADDTAIDEYTTTTDSAGYYSIPIDKAGVYDIVAKREGFAGTRYQNIVIKEKEIAEVDLVQPVAQREGFTTEPPIIYVSGIQSGQEIDGILNIKAKAYGTLPIEGCYWTRYKGIWLQIGNTARNINDAVSRNNTLDFEWNTENTKPGETFLHFVAMDVNLNRVELVIDCVKKVKSGAPPSFPLSAVYTNAVTFSGNKGMYSERRKALFSRLGLEGDPNVLKFKEKSIDLKTIPANTSVYVSLSWPRVPMATGYSIYRSPSNDPNNPDGYDYIGSTANGDYTRFYDNAADLSIDRKYTYTVRPYNEAGEGPPCNSYQTRVLPSYRIYLKSPGCDSISESENQCPNMTVRERTPVFEWDVSNIISGATRADQLYVFNLNVSFLSIPWGLLEDVIFINQTSTIYEGQNPLKNNEAYEWDIFDSRYSYYNGTASSISLPQYGYTTFGYSSNNGCYYFYTDFDN